MELLKRELNIEENQFAQPAHLGEEHVSDVPPSRLDSEHAKKLMEIVGNENVLTDSYTRVKFAYGKTMWDLFRLRQANPDTLPDAVICPRSTEDVVAIVRYCDQQGIAVIPFGAGSSAVRGVEHSRETKQGITLNLARHMNKILKVSDINHTCTVQPGIFGPDYEEQLNNAPRLFGSQHPYTGGHFPQSFEFSTVGGWIAAKGAGQASTHYGKIEDMVVATKWVTPRGNIETIDFPRAAIGPDIDQIFIGSEGCFGILVEATLKVWKYLPDERQYFSFMFRDFDSGMTAMREIMQGEYYKPSVFRISDGEETQFGLSLYGVADTPLAGMLDILGYKEGERALALGFIDGSREQALLSSALIHKTAILHGALPLGDYAVKNWMKGRYRDPYMREDLQDYGIIIDTLETAISWEKMPNLHAQVRRVIKSRPNTICLCHISHFYENGGNLYFIFIMKPDSSELEPAFAEFKEFQAKIFDAIRDYGGTMSHHHGVGKLMAPWLEEQLGKNQMDIFRALKDHFDPKNIMNPGTLGL